MGYEVENKVRGAGAGDTKITPMRTELIPRPGVDYFDSASWKFLESREKVKQYLKELLKSR